MLAIRPSQMQVFSQGMLGQFHDRMVAHLTRKYPEKTAAMPEPELRGFIQNGLEQAKNYQVKAEKDVRRYLECMMSHGAGFDRDPKCRWAGQILRRKKLTGTQKMDQISDYELFVFKGKA